MVDDDLEVIDLSLEEGDHDGRPREPFRPSRRQASWLGLVVVVVAAAIIVLAHRASDHASTTATSSGSSGASAPTSPAATASPTVSGVTLPPPSALTGIVADRVVEIVNGAPVLVTEDGSETQLLTELPGQAVLDVSQRGGMLISYQDTQRVVVGPTFDGSRNTLPAAFSLLPDAGGAWWTDYGPLFTTKRALQLVTPAGTTPVAKLLRGYLLLDRAHTALLEWQPGTAPVRIGTGDARVLAIMKDRVAWADAAGNAVHLANLLTGHTIDIDSGDSAITARFSPDGSRLAILTSGNQESMVLADSDTGRVLSRVATSTSDRALAMQSNVPPAFQPAPFSWDSLGVLVVFESSSDGDLVETVEPTDGSITLTVAAPDGLQQIVPLVP